MKKIDLILKILLLFSFVNVSYGQGGPYFGGASCASAVPIEVGEGYITNDFLSDDWYYFVAQCDGELEITNCDYGDNKQIIIYSGSCGSLVTEKTADGDDCSTNDVDPPFACMVGACTTCRCKLSEGSVEMGDCEALTPKEIEQGYILSCQAKPTSKKLSVNFDV